MPQPRFYLDRRCGHLGGARRPRLRSALLCAARSARRTDDGSPRRAHRALLPSHPQTRDGFSPEHRARVMNAPAPSPAAAEINRLHADVQRCNAESRAALNAALGAAWQAGRLLKVERDHVDETMHRGAWPLWVRRNFRGSWRTAHRYMKLADAISDASFVSGLSLRQAYFRLGIATEPKTHGGHAVAPLPDYVRL